MMQNYRELFGKVRQFFSKGGNDRSFRERLRDHYRLILMNEDTYSEVASFRMTPLNVYIFFSSIIVATATIVTLLIMYTPLKQYIPGYGDLARTREINDLKGRVRSMENEIKAHQKYQENIRLILNGDIVALSKDDTSEPDTNAIDLDSMMADVDRIPEDNIIREAVANQTTIPVRRTSVGDGGANQQYIPETPLEKIFFMPPLSGGDITARFDIEKEHFGIDISGTKNAAIRATHDGVVISAGYNVETGYSIAIQHKDNVITIFKHNSVLLKKAGASVKQGEAIAIIGNSGEQSTGPHLHFELWYRGRPVNPADYIKFQ